MNWFVKRFLQSALVWLGLGVSAGVHWWLSNVGLLLMVVGFILAPRMGAPSAPVLGTGGVLSALGAFAFIVNIWRTIDGPGVLSRVAQVQQARRLPLQ